MLALFLRIIRKVIRILDGYFSYTYSIINFKCNRVKYSSFRTKGVPFIDVPRNASLILGDNFAMNNGMSGNQIGFNVPCTFIVYPNKKLTIGNNVGISQAAIIAMDDVIIGDNVKIGGGVRIYTSDFHSLDYQVRRDRNQDMATRTTRPVQIKNDAFIGSGSVILKGVTIGERSIIGANSVVTKNVPDDEVWAGNPAKCIKHL